MEPLKVIDNVYLLNAPVATSPGVWLYYPVDVGIARTLISLSENVVSAIGHPATAKVLSELLGVKVEVNRVTVDLKPKEIAIIFRLKQRVPPGVELDVEELNKIGYDLWVGLKILSAETMVRLIFDTIIKYQEFRLVFESFAKMWFEKYSMFKEEQKEG